MAWLLTMQERRTETTMRRAGAAPGAHPPSKRSSAMAAESRSIASPTVSAASSACGIAEGNDLWQTMQYGSRQAQQPSAKQHKPQG